MARIRKLELARICDEIRSFLDGVGDYEDGEFDKETEEMLETMQSAWEETSRVAHDMIVGGEDIRGKTR